MDEMYKAFFISFLALSVSALLAGGAAANEILNVQSSACVQGKNDCTRVIFTMKDPPKFNVFKTKDDRTEYTVVLSDIADPSKKTGVISIKRSSVISNVGIKRAPRGQHDQVHYVFFLKSGVTPGVKKSGSSFWVDFPHQEPGASKGESSTSPAADSPGYSRKEHATSGNYEPDDRKTAKNRNESDTKQLPFSGKENGNAHADSRDSERSGSSGFSKNDISADRRDSVPAGKKPAPGNEGKPGGENRTDREAGRETVRETNSGKNGDSVKKTNSVSAGNPSRGKKSLQDIRELEEELFQDLNSEGDNKTPSESLEKRLAAPEPPKPAAYKRKSSATCTVVVDPGHGGKDPGAIGVGNVQEKAVTLGISRSLVAYLDSDPLLVGKLTRNRDIFIELGQRSQIARNKNANFLISIHADSALNSQAQGVSVLVLNRDRANRENNKSVQNNDNTRMLSGLGEFLKDHADPMLQKVAVDMASNTSRSDGNDLAKEILGSLGKITTLHKSVPINRSLAVLKAPDIPSLLIETGYLSNPDEASLLATGKYQRAIAHAIYLGIRSFVYKNKDTLRCGITAREPADEHRTTPAKNRRTTAGNSKAPATGQTVIYVVKKGEYLSKIAQNHGVSLEYLRKLNHLSSDKVHTGQRLKVPKKK